MDERILPLMRTGSVQQRFIVAALATLLGSKLIEVLDGLNDRGMQPDEMVAGRPFAYWLGRSAESVKSEVGDAKYREISKAHRLRGIDWGDEYSASFDPVIADVTPVQSPAATEDPMYAGHFLSELVNLSDEELLAIEGIGPATIRKIRQSAAR